MSFEKPDCPFYPDRSLPPENFFGRTNLVEKIWKRSVQPVYEFSRTEFLWICGEDGMGKSSLAAYLMRRAQRHKLFGLRIDLSRVGNLDGLVEAILLGILNVGITDPGPAGDLVKGAFKRYFEAGENSLPVFGETKISIRYESLKNDLQDYLRNFELFLEKFIERLKTKGFSGMFLLLDELNVLANDKKFAGFIKSLSENLYHHAGLALTICGTEERRFQIIRHNPSTDRIFEVFRVGPMSYEHLASYFAQEFARGRISFEENQIPLAMAKLSEGQPKLAQVIGKNVFYANDDRLVNEEDLQKGLLGVKDEIAEKLIKPRHKELLQEDHLRIMEVILREVDPVGLSFYSSEVRRQLEEEPRKKFGNFLQKMKDLKFINMLEKGRYAFCDLYTKASFSVYLSHASERLRT